ncbi:MAG: hypothetical protein K6G52_03845, partial [Treponemataceae bacterium]|nr:hypothetical protein [Treponemataceae bacterium]
LGDSSTTGVNISGLDSYTTYYFWVYAKSIGGKGKPSSAISAQTVIGCPESLTATKYSDTQICLTWSAVETCDSYVLYRNASGVLDDAEKIAEISVGSTTYYDNSPEENLNYYWIRCKKDSATSSDSAFAYCRLTAISYGYGLSAKLSNTSNASAFNFYTNMSMTPNGNNVYFLSTNPSSTSSSVYSGNAISNSVRLQIFDNDYPVLKAGSSSRNTVVCSNQGFTAEDKLLSEFEFNDNSVKRTDKTAAVKFNSEAHDFKTPSSRNLLRSSSAESRSYSVGDTKSFYIDDADGNFSSVSASLKAESTNCYVWVVSDIYDNTSSSVSDNKITTSQLEALATKFELIYGPETAVFGKAYKDMDSQISGYVPKSEKISILVFDIDGDYTALQSSGTLGYFWGKDMYYDSAVQSSGVRSNECEIFYIDSHFLDRYQEFVYSTLAHEFQHMLHFVHKNMEQSLTSSTWFNEMLSMVCEDLLQETLGTTDEYSPKSRLTYFNLSYAYLGLTEWNENYTAYSYSNAYAFGAWLIRNYGGAELVKRMASNAYVNLTCITEAIEHVTGSSITVAELLRQFSRSLCYPELTYEAYRYASTNGLKPFCNTNSTTLTGTDGSTTYTYNLSSILLSDYTYAVDGTYYTGPYYYSTGYNYALSKYGNIVIDLGAVNSDTARYISASPAYSYFVIQ